MSQQAVKWALDQSANTTDKAVLASLAFDADRHDVCELDEDKLRSQFRLTRSGLVKIVASLAERGLIKGPRWAAGRGWVATGVQLGREPHLQAVDGRKAA